MENIEKTNFVPLYSGPVFMRIADDETVPTISGKDYTIDLKGEGSNTFNVNSAGQIYLKSTNYSGNDGLILELQQGGIKLDSVI